MDAVPRAVSDTRAHQGHCNVITHHGRGTAERGGDMSKAITTVGLFTFLLGACAMDSADLTVPVLMCVSGMVMMAATINAYKI